MVLTERLELGIKLMDAIFVSRPCQFLHLIGKLRGAHEDDIRPDAIGITYALTLDLLKSLLGGRLLVIAATRDARGIPTTS